MKSRPTLHERLSTRRALIGLLQTHPSPAFAEMAGMCGYDFLILDDEHGVFSAGDYLHALRALSATGMAAFVRLSGHDLQAVGRYLDMGADGIVVPHVTTAEQASDLVRAMEYPPVGTRGFGASAHRATRYGLNLVEHLKAPRQGASLLLIIESALGAVNAQAILDVEGVDGVIIGPSDLSADLGCTRDFSHPDYMNAVASIERAAITQGKVLGTVPHAGNALEALVARGHRLLIAGADMPLIRDAMTSQIEKAKPLLE